MGDVLKRPISSGSGQYCLSSTFKVLNISSGLTVIGPNYICMKPLDNVSRVNCKMINQKMLIVDVPNF